MYQHLQLLSDHLDYSIALIDSNSQRISGWLYPSYHRNCQMFGPTATAVFCPSPIFATPWKPGKLEGPCHDQGEKRCWQVASQSFPCSFGCLDPQWCLPGRWKMTKGNVKKPLLWISMVYTVYRTYRHIMNRSRCIYLSI